jgi:hypothetical protein
MIIKMEKKYLFIGVFSCMILFVLINTFIKSRRECMKEYNFTITKIEVTPTRRLEFYNGNEKVILWSYIVLESEGVRVGDILCKKKCSKFLYIYRKNEKGENEEYLKVKPSGLFPVGLFCNNEEK